MLPEIIQQNRAWTLTLLSSLMCVLGATIIYLDAVVKWINPHSQFSIRANERFLISGFSLSCGSLMLTSLYKLLPKGFQNFEKAYKKSHKKDATTDGLLFDMGPNTATMLSFISGILVCYGLNELIHYATSESVVHCAHGGDDSESEHSHSHSHSSLSGPDEEDDLKHTHTHNHGHSHDHQEHHPHEHSNHSHTHFHDEESAIESVEPHAVIQDVAVATETTPLSPHESSTAYVVQDPTIVPRKSLINLLTHPQTQPVCQGIYDTNCGGFPCVNEQLTDRVSNDIHNLDFYRDLSLRRTKSSIVAYTTDQALAGSPRSHAVEASASQDLNSPAEQFVSSSVITTMPSNIRLTTEPNLDRHTQHTDDHHHQINTPVSRLLSIALQTCLALSLHKFPEGFITYATTRADPELGLSIFLSLAIHNIVEGFTMVLPLYLALNSRAKAFGITVALGGLSQPIGGLAATYFMKDHKIGKDSSLGVFGVLMSLTSGFLTVISLQLFASAINFGGSTTTVIRWSVLGMFVIMLSSTLTDLSS